LFLRHLATAGRPPPLTSKAQIELMANNATWQSNAGVAHELVGCQ